MEIKKAYQRAILKYGIWNITRKISNIEKKRHHLCSIMGFNPFRSERWQRAYFSDGNLYRKKISLEGRRDEINSKLALLTN